MQLRRMTHPLGASEVRPVVLPSSNAERQTNITEIICRDVQQWIYATGIRVWERRSGNRFSGVAFHNGLARVLLDRRCCRFASFVRVVLDWLRVCEMFVCAVMRYHVFQWS